MYCMYYVVFPVYRIKPQLPLGPVVEGPGNLFDPSTPDTDISLKGSQSVTFSTLADETLGTNSRRLPQFASQSSPSLLIGVQDCVLVPSPYPM